SENWQNRSVTTVEAKCSLKNRPALRLDSRLVCKYEVLAVIGKGSFSQYVRRPPALQMMPVIIRQIAAVTNTSNDVLRVQHRLTHKYYAVKLVSSDCGTVNNELSILSRVQHPHVIRLEEVFKSSSRLFIVMEMASGGEMYNRVVAKGRYSETEARQALRMLLNGLAYLHSIRVTHRDLKPENLLYSDTTPDARLLITDFGLAYQAQTSEEKMTETCGTPEYIAPEVLLRSAYTDKVDMWAVGVIAYILMSGIMPFDDDCRSRLYTQIITANYIYYPQFWSGSELAKDFVDALLETDPDTRLSATDAVKHEWFMGNRSQLKVIIKTRPASDFTTIQRTRSTRSIRSVTRSDHGHRVDPREVDRLASDLQRLAKFQQHSTKHYGFL
ncbi:unnamed protein product, partial [Acanthocheilonema viteae]